MMKKALIMVILAALLIAALTSGTACKVGPKFEVSPLTITPTEVVGEETFTVVADVENVGDSDGTFTTTLTVDKETADTQEITVAAGETETVTFSLTRDPGTYTIELDGVTETLTVLWSGQIVQANFYDIEIPDGPGLAVIIGELENTSDVAVVSPIIVEVWDSSGEPVPPRDPSGGVLEDEFLATAVHFLPPEVKAPFFFPLGPPPVANFEGSTVTALSVSATPDDLENYHSELVATHQGTFEGPVQQLRFVIEGTVKNTGSDAAKEVRVIASCYDDQGTILGTGTRVGLWRTDESGQHFVEFLLPGEEADFQITEIITPDAELITSYTLQVQGLWASPEEVTTAQAEEAYIANIHQIINDTLGESNRGVIRIQATGVSSNGRIRITFTLQDAEDYQAILSRAKADVRAVMRALYTSGLLVSEVTMIGTFPISDGGEEEVVTAILSEETAQQLDWAVMAPARLWEELDNSWVHPTLLGQ